MLSIKTHYGNSMSIKIIILYVQFNALMHKCTTNNAVLVELILYKLYTPACIKQKVPHCQYININLIVLPSQLLNILGLLWYSIPMLSHCGTQSVH